VFTTNPDYRVGGVTSLTEKPLYLAEGHASRNLIPALWVSTDAYYNVGGETSIDGVEQNNAANTLRLGSGLGLNIWGGGDVVVNYERVVAKPVATGCANRPGHHQTGRVSARRAATVPGDNWGRGFATIRSNYIVDRSTIRSRFRHGALPGPPAGPRTAGRYKPVFAFVVPSAESRIPIGRDSG
jgi:hypothetical protein